jgi:hypothetical protein
MGAGTAGERQGRSRRAGCRRPQQLEQIEAVLKSRTPARAERGYHAEQVDADIACRPSAATWLEIFGSRARVDGEPMPSLMWKQPVLNRIRPCAKLCIHGF